MQYFDVTEDRPIVLGRVGENEVRVIRFHKKAIFPFFDSYESEVTYQRQGDSGLYGADVYEDDDYIYWPVGSFEVENLGSGVAQITAVNGSAVAKSCVFTTIVKESLDEDS